MSQSLVEQNEASFEALSKREKETGDECSDCSGKTTTSAAAAVAAMAFSAATAAGMSVSLRQSSRGGKW